MIDSLNGGQTCLQCRNFVASGERQDRFFGKLPVKSYCKKFEHTVHPEEGENCLGFLRKIFAKD